MGEERLNRRPAQLARMPPPAEADKVAYPVDVCSLGSYAVVAIANALAHLIQRAARLQQRPKGGFHGGVDAVPYYSIP